MMNRYNDNSVGIVLVNYNNIDCIGSCLKRIFEQSYTNYKVFVVDNASMDGSVRLVEDMYPQVVVIRSEKNIGWGEGSNIGIRAAMDEGMKYILLLNTDTEIAPDMLTCLLKYADENTIVAPYMFKIEASGEEVPWYAGGKIDIEGCDVEQRIFANFVSDRETYEVDFITGCCMLIHSEIIKQVGVFSPEYFMYFEDVDYCLRLKEKGYRMLYVPAAKLWHKIGGSAGGETSYISQYYTVRNKLYFAEKFKSFFKQDGIDVLRNILQGRAYFEAPDTQKYKKFVLAGIKDFLQGKMGKENCLIDENAYFLEGFLEREEDAFNSWRWACKKKTSIEVVNHAETRHFIKLSFFLAPPPGKDNRKISVKINENVIGEFNAPVQVDLIEMFESREIKLVTISTREKLVKTDGDDPRKFAYQFRNFQIKIIE